MYGDDLLNLLLKMYPYLVMLTKLLQMVKYVKELVLCPCQI